MVLKYQKMKNPLGVGSTGPSSVPASVSPSVSPSGVTDRTRVVIIADRAGDAVTTGEDDDQGIVCN